MRSGAVSRESTVDLTEEIYEHLARSGEVPPYLADVTAAGADHRGEHNGRGAGTEAGGI